MRGRGVFGSGDAAVWHPGAAELSRSRLARAMAEWGADDLAALHRYSVDEADAFWARAVEDLGIAFSTPWERVLDALDGHAVPRWFTGGRINVVDSCVTRWAGSGRAAVISECDDGTRREMSYATLAAEVERVAAGLAVLGIGRGDRVALFLPVIPEAAVAMLACAKIGAVVVPCFSGYGPEPLAARLGACGARALVTVEATTRRGARVAMREVAEAAGARCATVEHVLVAGGAAWDALGRGAAPVPTEAMEPNAPLAIIYTSGTTGAPKGIVHSHAGFLVKAGVDFGYCFDVQEGDRIGWIADMGWMLGPLMVLGTLQFGATIVWIEGLPTWPDATRLWDIAERNGVTVLGLAPTAARGIRAATEGAAPKHDLSSLRAFASTGEAWDVPTWKWLFRDVGKGRLPILNYSGGTETGGGILSNYTIAPMAPAGFAGPILGLDVDVLGEDGAPAQGIGELVVRNTWPGMTHGFWEDRARYLATYWERWPDVWVHGDLAEIDADGVWHIRGRSDDTIKVAGRRVGPAEIESALVADPQIAEAAVIGVPDEEKGSVIVAFVALARPGAFEAESARASVARLVGRAMVPARIVAVAGLPKTKNGKIMRRAIRARYLGEAPGDLSALDAATPLDLIPDGA